LFKRVLFTIFVICLCSCSNDATYTTTKNNGIETIRNNGKPADPNLNFDLKELYTIKFDNYDISDSLKTLYAVEAFEVDHNDNVYLLDLSQSKVHKFDSNGKYLLNFCKKGSGPGETLLTTDLLVKKDTVMIADPRMRNLVHFDANGKFIKRENFNVSVPSPIKRCGEKFIGTVYHQNKKTEIASFNTMLLSPEMNEEKKLWGYELSKDYHEMDEKYLDVFPPFAVTDKYIYHSVPEGDIYRIKVFDNNGNQVQTIQKKSRKLMFSNKEKGFALKRFNYVKDDQRFKKFPYKYKKQVNFIIPETNETIWVLSSIDRTKKKSDIFNIDVFTKGIFQNNIQIKGKLTWQDFHFRNMKYKIKNNRFYQYSGHEDKLRVFEIVKKQSI